jgi:hypothetical protein
VVTLFFAGAAGAAERASFDAVAKTYVDGVKKVNAEHLAKPGKDREPDLGKKLPAPARFAFNNLLKAKDAPGLGEALVLCGEAAVDLDLLADFEKVRARLEKSFPDDANRLGTALSRPRFILKGLNGIDRDYLESFADVLDGILGAYDEVFGFKEWSKVAGKKLRVRIHHDPDMKRPPHFAPEFPYHSEIDFPVLDAKKFSSPSPRGHFFFYGLCHELGHVFAMWGNMNLQEDKHSWAHYTGVTIVEHLSENAGGKPFMAGLRDVNWQSLKKERERLKGKAPSKADADGVLALLIALHDKVGPKAIGAAMNFLDAQDRRLRINRVRYYTFAQLREGFLATLKDPKGRKAVDEVLPAGR